MLLDERPTAKGGIIFVGRMAREGVSGWQPPVGSAKQIDFLWPLHMLHTSIANRNPLVCGSAYTDRRDKCRWIDQVIEGHDAER
jgi:hypothetical protein